MDTEGGGGEVLADLETEIDIQIIETMHKIDNQREPDIQHRELYSALCGDLNGKKIQNRGDIWLHIADSLCYAEDTNTTL